MNRLFTALAIVLLLASCDKIKPVPDAKMYGFKGKIMTSIKKIYNKVKFINGEWQPLDTSDFQFSFHEFYDLEGYIDSMWFFAKDPDTNKPINKRRIKVLKDGSRQKTHTYENGVLVENEITEWETKKKFSSRTFDIYGTLKIYISVELSETLFEKNSVYNYYSVNGSILKSITREYLLESDSLRQEAIEKNMLDNTQKSEVYNFIKWDQFGYPIKTIQFDNSSRVPTRIIIGETTYY